MLKALHGFEHADCWAHTLTRGRFLVLLVWVKRRDTQLRSSAKARSLETLHHYMHALRSTLRTSTVSWGSYSISKTKLQNHQKGKGKWREKKGNRKEHSDPEQNPQRGDKTQINPHMTSAGRSWTLGSRILFLKPILEVKNSIAGVKYSVEIWMIKWKKSLKAEPGGRA